MLTVELHVVIVIVEKHIEVTVVLSILQDAQLYVEVLKEEVREKHFLILLSEISNLVTL